MGAVSDDRLDAERRSSPSPADVSPLASGRAGLHTADTAPDHLRMFVPGLPRPQGSMRAFKVGSRIQMVHAKGGELNVWRAAITQAAYDLWGDHPPLDEPVVVTLAFWLPRPKSIPKKRRHPDRLPDLDKLSRAVLDSLAGIVFTDDARVVRLVADKHYAVDCPSGADISMWPVEV